QTPARPTVDFCPRLKPPAVYAHRSPLGTYLRCPTISALGSTEPNQLRYPRRPRYLVKQESGGLLLLRRITPRFRGVMRSIFTLALRPRCEQQRDRHAESEVSSASWAWKRWYGNVRRRIFDISLSHLLARP